MLEKDIEKKLTKAVKKKGGLALKFYPVSMVGIPDRIILMPKGRLAFVELKAPGNEPRLIQEKRKRQLESLGFLVFILDDVTKIGDVLDEIQRT